MKVTTSHPILSWGQHRNGSWEPSPPPGYTPVRFAIGDARLRPGDCVELLLGSTWVRARFEGPGSTSNDVELSFELGEHNERVEHVIVPADAHFRLLAPEDAA